VTAKTSVRREHSVRRFVASLLLTAAACLAVASPAVALDFNPADYFNLTYQPITFDKSQVAAGETFHANIRGRAVCNKNIPLPVSRATIVSQVTARSAAGGASYTLNPGFTIEINPFPDKAGDTFDIDESINLQFPLDASPGDYQVVWQIVQARAKIGFIPTDVSDYIPPEQPMGSISVVSPAKTGAAPQPGTTTTSAPSTPSVSPAHITPTTTPAPGFVVPWWAFPLGVLVVIAIIVIVIVLLIRRRRQIL
jgi:hypothetical protein